MATLGSLVVEINANVARLQGDMNRASSTVQGGMAKISKAAAVARIALASLGVGLGVAAFVSFAKKGIDAADAAGKVAQKIGISTAQFTKYAYAANLGDVSTEKFGAQLIKLSQNVDKAASGQKVLAEQFARIGIDAEELRGRDVGAIFEKIVGSLSKVPDGAAKTRVAVALLGKGAADLIPLINEGTEGLQKYGEEAERTGNVITDKTAKAADEFNDSLDRLGKVSSGLGIALANKLLPSINDIADAFVRGREQGGLFDATIEALRETVAQGIGDPLTNQIDGTIDKIDALKSRLSDLKGETFFGKVDRAGDAIAGRDPAFRIRATEAAISALNKKLADQKALQRDLAETDKPGARAGAVSETPDTAAAEAASRVAASAAKAAANARQRAIDSEKDYILRLEHGLALERDSSEASKARFDLVDGEAKAFSAAGKARIEIIAREIDLSRESAEVQKALQESVASREEAFQSKTVERAKEKAATIEGLRTPLEKYADEVKRLQSLGIGSENLQRGIARAREEMEATTAAASKTNDVANQLGLTFSSAFEDAIVNGAKFSDVLAGIEKDLIRIITRKLVIEPLGDALSGAVKGLVGGGGGAGMFAGIGKLFGFAAGGSFQVGGAGGIDSQMVAFRASPGERVTVGESSGGPGVTININNPRDAESIIRSRGQIEASLRAATQRGVRNS